MPVRGSRQGYSQLKPDSHSNRAGMSGGTSMSPPAQSNRTHFILEWVFSFLVPMPYKPASSCLIPGCPHPATVHGYCSQHYKAYRQSLVIPGGPQYDRHWRKARSHYLNQHPLCVMCMKEGRVEEATELDHVIPHKGSFDLFWRQSNWQGLCVHHHGAKTARETILK